MDDNGQDDGGMDGRIGEWQEQTTDGLVGQGFFLAVSRQLTIEGQRRGRDEGKDNAPKHRTPSNSGTNLPGDNSR